MSKEGNGGFWVEEHSLWKMSVELQSINSVQGTEGCILGGFCSKDQTVAVCCGTYRDAIGWSAIHMKQGWRYSRWMQWL